MATACQPGSAGAQNRHGEHASNAALVLSTETEASIVLEPHTLLRRASTSPGAAFRTAGSANVAVVRSSRQTTTRGKAASANNAAAPADRLATSGSAVNGGETTQRQAGGSECAQLRSNADQPMTPPQPLQHHHQQRQRRRNALSSAALSARLFCPFFSAVLRRSNRASTGSAMLAGVQRNRSLRYGTCGSSKPRPRGGTVGASGRRRQWRLVPVSGSALSPCRCLDAAICCRRCLSPACQPNSGGETRWAPCQSRAAHLCGDRQSQKS